MVSITLLVSRPPARLPACPSARLPGSWSNYPYFDSGIIVVTSMREGVFVLKKRDTRLVF